MMAVLSENLGDLLFTWFSIRVGFSFFTLLSELVTCHVVAFSQGESGTAPPYPSGNSQLHRNVTKLTYIFMGINFKSNSSSFIIFFNFE